MSCTIKLRKYYPEDGSFREYEAENFGEAVVCCGHVALREDDLITVNDAPGQCWGEYICADAGSYDALEGRMLERDSSWCIDDAGARLELIRIECENPLRLEYSRHIGVSPLRRGEKMKKSRFAYIANLRCRPIPDSRELEIVSAEDRREIILIPGRINGQKVRRADLSLSDLSNCRCLIVDPSVSELKVNFEKACFLGRIEIADSTSIIGGPAYINRTEWFRTRPKGAVYLSRWYCGSAGGCDYGSSILELKDGCIGVAPNADSSSYWKKIVFPKSVRTIGSNAFSCMSCLKEIVFSEGLERVEDFVFWNCPRVEHLYLPDSLHHIGMQSLDLFEALKSASMHYLSYTDSEHFLSYCDEIVLRGKPEGKNIKIHKRYWPSKPVSGERTAYGRGRTLYVNGRSYRSLTQLTAEQPDPQRPVEYRDIYGNTVIFLNYLDRKLFTGGKNLYYNEKRWFVIDSHGVSQISRKDNDRTFMVHENMDKNDISSEYLEYVERFFDDDAKKED